MFLVRHFYITSDNSLNNSEIVCTGDYRECCEFLEGAYGWHRVVDSGAVYLQGFSVMSQDHYYLLIDRSSLCTFTKPTVLQVKNECMPF